MLGFILLSVFLIVLGTIIFIEIRNEKRYQATRAQERGKSFKKKDTTTPTSKSPEPTKPSIEKQKESSIPPKFEKILPQAHYPRFSHQRLIDMGLSDDEAKEFVRELIPQLESQIPLIEAVLNIPDFHQMESLTHSIKGSATNIGTGGISDLLVDYNTYLKSNTDSEIATSLF